MISRAEQCIRHEIISLDGPVGGEDVLARQGFPRASRVQAGKVVSQGIGATDGTVGKSRGSFEDVAILDLGKVA